MSENPPVPFRPTAAHWLGDRDAADETRHAADRRGVVLYFYDEAACRDFLAWLTQVNAPVTAALSTSTRETTR